MKVLIHLPIHLQIYLFKYSYEPLSKHDTYPGFAIITWNNPKKLEKACITKGLATCQSLGLIFSCNKALVVDPVLHPRHLTNWYQQLPLLMGVYLFQTIIWGLNVSFRCRYGWAKRPGSHHKSCWKKQSSNQAINQPIITPIKSNHH